MQLETWVRGDSGSLQHWALIQMVRHKGINDPDVFEILITLRGHPPLKLGAFDVSEEGTLWLHRLRAIVSA